MQISKALASTTGVAAAALTLTGWGITAAVGSADTPAPAPAQVSSIDQIDGPAPVLLESVHAPGKAITIVGRDAETGAWPAENRSIPSDAEEILDQAVQMHPVAGVENAYVLTSIEGDVLARVDGSRDLEVRDQDVATASADPLATWTVTSNGTASKIVNAAPFDGVEQALDLYDWSTVDGARVGVWDDNDFGTNQSWRIHPLTASVERIGSVVAPGDAPELPGTVAGSYGWGASVEVSDIAWDAPESEAWQADGEVTFTGAGTGMFGEDVVVEATFTVGTVGDAAPVSLNTYAGVLLHQLRGQAPTTVERSVSGSAATVTADVEWDWSGVTQQDLDSVGSLEVAAAEGTGFAATLIVTISEPARVAVLAGAAADAEVRGWSLSGTDPVALTDGDTEAEGWGNWRSGGAANRVSPDWVAFYLPTPTQIDRVELVEPAGADNIGAVTVQYRDVHGGWVDVSTGTVDNSGGRLALDTTFDPVLATGVRALIEHKSDATWMQLSELRAWGPGLAG
ncbi:RICIN domain-containing protein [Demequina sp. NBRC 110053]|uniref:RICIN domain-containing protein n=1 Tax=Demequina sp. NBRC 110053 TaxID=1570342 RepID=UPI001356623B|nr:RICIN domain-containing protein [Demequina sp. NBRC 110053]